MALNFDVALFNNDLYIDPSTGDFVFAESDEQHIIDTIAAFPGWWKENPADGVGLFQYENSSGQEQVLERSIKINLQGDGYQVNNPSVTRDASGNLVVQPNATKV
ncbi:hypothetical protein J3L18_30960 [Mucilaginibacter gossypii]|uniref:hypothetical protein n=1 Tax=Mucilaginibacter gossypii TaxID=551996 RepID=UPI000DCB6A04|nr:MULTISPECIES: hypothetical protein [Mucilaginibacter]QTE37468.1 hypothetical protein J3L18_30960 [Mucilaginibacter gossypii]RAV52294.1 hypothetical protein DIU36_24475 [Mucilaginibacter rubeus]